MTLSFASLFAAVVIAFGLPTLSTAGQLEDNLARACQYFDGRAFRERALNPPDRFSIRVAFADRCSALLAANALHDPADPLHSLATDSARSLIEFHRTAVAHVLSEQPTQWGGARVLGASLTDSVEHQLAETTGVYETERIWNAALHR